MSSIFISVIMPAYNCERFVGAAIESVLHQTYTNWELIICDDGSIDGTFNIIKKYDDYRIKVFRNNINIGKQRTVNSLLNETQGELITIHDADDISFVNRFEKITEVFENNLNVFACGHSIQRMSENGKPLNLYRSKHSNFEKIKSNMLVSNTDGDPSLFMKREILLSLGEIYRPYFKVSEDYDLALRIIEKFEITNLTEVLSYYRNVSNSLSKTVNSYHKLIFEDIAKYFAKERESKGKDSLERGEFDFILTLEDNFAIPYREDKTLHLRKMASFFMYCKMNKSAISYMIMAVKLNPFKFENWRTLQYCLRKTIIGF